MKCIENPKKKQNQCKFNKTQWKVAKLAKATWKSFKHQWQINKIIGSQWKSAQNIREINRMHENEHEND